MGNGTESGRSPQRRIDAEAKQRFLERLRAGGTMAEAAAAGGFSAEAFYGARKRDAVFKLGWLWAIELSTEDERQKRRTSSLVALVDGVEIAPNNRRPLQKRVVRATRFTPERRQTFLDVFAATADFNAAAEAAGVSPSTVYKALAREPDFARRRDEARALALTRLEDEAVRQRLEAQQRLRDAAMPECELAIENERLMKLLAYYQRERLAGGAIGPGAGGMARWSFDDSIRLLDQTLRAYGLRRGISPPGADGGPAEEEE